ncbi:hypothetical protein EVAR_86417_1 [Eumeta japonica]|uniref:Uncharacterized protein n=1 Tax=Eumeta variegata TaxID=151549 RepID=A0A4C1W7Z3_EUMVA|nr:hypothetical protein EVAR_86417_1 [Eumeta japonica]
MGNGSGETHSDKSLTGAALSNVVSEIIVHSVENVLEPTSREMLHSSVFGTKFLNADWGRVDRWKWRYNEKRYTPSIQLSHLRS